MVFFLDLVGLVKKMGVGPVLVLEVLMSKREMILGWRLEILDLGMDIEEKVCQL